MDRNFDFYRGYYQDDLSGTSQTSEIYSPPMPKHLQKVFTPNNSANLESESCPSTPIEWIGCNPNCIIKQMKELDHMKEQGCYGTNVRSFYSSYPSWEVMSKDQKKNL
jgi:hypothetical protein